MVRIISSLIILASLLGSGLDPLYAAANGRIVGTVTDASTGAPLPGANLFLDGTAIGAVSVLKGAYQIQRIPSGSFILKIRFVGYKGKEVPVNIAEDESKNINIKLEYDVLKGETVTITAQAEGQVAAINQQLRSNTITNVVSAERIMELPDANAAESVGRLPGVSILRTKAGHRIVMNDNDELVIFAHGGDQAEIRLTRQGEVIIKAQKIKLGSDSASEPLVLGNAFLQFFNTHTHPTGVGPSGPPAQPMTPSQLSTKHSTE